MPHYYILDEEKKAIPVEDTREWAEKFDEEGRRVGDTKIGDLRISTVFLGIDHSFSLDKTAEVAPILFETMIFDESKGGGWKDIFLYRYSTWKEAELGHDIICSLVEVLRPATSVGEEK